MSESPTSDVIETAVYDLDGVITYKDSFSAVIKDLLRRRPQQLVKALPAAALMMLSGHTNHRHRCARLIARIALAGLSHAEYRALAEAFGRRIGTDPTWMRTEAVERIRRQHDDGTRIVIATATEASLAESLLDHAGVPYDVLSASQLQETGSGMSVADHRVGSRKTEALRELGIDIGAAEFITDSMTDLPTAQAAARVILIGATEKTKRRFAQASVPIAGTNQAG